jgi:hypothetical protein
LTRAAKVFAVSIAAIATSLFCATSAGAAVGISRFAVTPSTTQVGGHPTLDLSVAFDPPTSEVKNIVLHLPAGLSANSRAAPPCRSELLLSDLCPLSTKVGTVSLVGEALGFQAEARRNIYNLRLTGAEQLLLGVPIFGSFSRGGIALTLPVTRRADGGLDVAVAGPPREVAGYAIRLKQVGFRISGTVRRKRGKRVRRRALLTNPRTCGPASTALEITTYDVPPATFTQTSAFTITGC